MTRKQAEKVAATLVKLARAAGFGDPGGSWPVGKFERATFEVEPALAAKVDEAPGFVNGCLPMGWRLQGPTGTRTITILRPVT